MTEFFIFGTEAICLDKVRYLKRELFQGKTFAVVVELVN